MSTNSHRDMTTLRNAQDLDRTNRMKDLAKDIKNPDELNQHKRRENKKHVEQSVKERQKVSLLSSSPSRVETMINKKLFCVLKKT